MLPSGTSFLVARLTGRAPSVASEPAQIAAAKSVLRREQAGARVDVAIKALRAKAAIEYVSAADRPKS